MSWRIRLTRGQPERLVDFWNYLSKDSMVETNPFFKPWWDYWHAINREIATGEAARRYFSAKEFAIFGVPNVFYPHRPTRDSKFYDSDNTWYRYSNEPLRRSLETVCKISNSYYQGRRSAKTLTGGSRRRRWYPRYIR